MSVKKGRDGRWRFRKWIHLPNGERVRINGTPRTSNTKAAALAEEAREIARRMTGKGEPEAPAVPMVGEYADLYLEAVTGKPGDLDSVRQILKANIRPRFGDTPLNEVMQSDVDRWSKELGRTRSAKTVNNITSVLARVMRYAAKNHVIPPVLITFRLKVALSKIEAITAEDFETLLEATKDPRYRAGLLLGFEAGLRIGEIRALQWQDYNEVQRELVVSRSYDKRQNLGATKSDETRLVPAPRRLRDALSALPRRGVTCITRQRDVKPLSYWAMRDGILELYDRAKVKRPVQPWHCLRHGFCTEHANAGTPGHLLMEMAGHKSYATTLRYISSTREAKRDAADRVFGQTVGKEHREKVRPPGEAL